MEIITLKCNSCGADLKINPAIKFFNCSFCKSSLAIKNSGNVSYTEVLGDIKENTEKLLDDSETILIEKEIERLDREWTINREKYRTRGENGGVFPTAASTTMTLIVAAIALGMIAFFWVHINNHFLTVFGATNGMVQLGGFVFVAVLLWTTGVRLNKTANYLKAEKEYKRKRANLMKDLN